LWPFANWGDANVVKLGHYNKDANGTVFWPPKTVIAGDNTFYLAMFQGVNGSG
jgi:hypothetical protein